MTAEALLRHLAFACALALLSAAAVRVMISARLLDRPNARKAHTVPTPKGGGVGIVLAFLVGVAVLYRYAEFGRLAEPYFRGVILAAIAIAVVAFFDDIKDWPFTVKLGAQVLAAIMAVGSGLYIDDLRIPYVGVLQIGVLGAVLSIAWIVFATNAVNFIDGMNGLVAGSVLVTCAFLAAIAAAQGGWFVYFASLILGAGVAGFLPFNYPSARIFMGDVGSQFCGFILAILAIAAGRFQGVELSFVLVPFMLSGIIFDVIFTLCRRALVGERVTQAHRGHLYQVAARSGMDSRWIAVLYWGFAAYGGLGCLLFIGAAPMWKPLILLMPLPVQLVWLWAVRRAAQGAGLERW